MRNIINALIITVVLAGTINAQNINLSELTPGPAFLDAKGGSIAKGDIDNDGDIDVFIAGYDGNQRKSTLYTNDGEGNFTMTVGTPFVGLQFGGSEFADVDQDGDIDLFITGSDSQSVYHAKLYLNNGSGVFSLASNTAFQTSSRGDIAFSDIDNDNDLDLMIVGVEQQGDGFTKLYQNDGFGVFTELSTSTFESARSGSIAFFDYDNDTDNDVIVSGENNSGQILTTLYSNNGSGVFTIVPNTAFPGTKSGDIAIADTDNDGDLDVLINGVTPPMDYTTEIFLNDGVGGFSFLTSTNFPGTSLGNVEFADFDNDDDMDILITGETSPYFGGAQFISKIFENTGLNNFVLADNLTPMSGTSTVIADFDGDNDLDVIVTGMSKTPTSSKTRMFTNNLIILSVSENEMNFGISVYPNPSNSLINVNLNEGQLKRLEVYELDGSLIFATTLSSKQYSLKIVDFPLGKYILRIVNQNYEVATIKFIKE